MDMHVCESDSVNVPFILLTKHYDVCLALG